MVVHPPVDLRKRWTLIEDFEHGETFDGPPRSTYGPPAYQSSPTLITNSLESKWVQMGTRRKNSENQWKNGGRRGIRSPHGVMYDTSVKLVNADGVRPWGCPLYSCVSGIRLSKLSRLGILWRWSLQFSSPTRSSLDGRYQFQSSELFGRDQP